MVQTFKISDVSCSYVGRKSGRIVYVVYPLIEALTQEFIEKMAQLHDVSVAVVYVPASGWNNYLTPWPEPGEAKGFPPFAGEGTRFLDLLTEKLMPQVEKNIGLMSPPVRDLIGVSLSGLFALWQWLQCDVFNSIACLSGSFWYAGFMEWFEARTIPAKKGSAYFLLGEEEPKAKIKAYQPVGVNTQDIVERLKSCGVAAKFEWVPGNHFSQPIHRLELGFANLEVVST